MRFLIGDEDAFRFVALPADWIEEIANAGTDSTEVSGSKSAEGDAVI